MVPTLASVAESRGAFIPDANTDSGDAQTSTAGVKSQAGAKSW